MEAFAIKDLPWLSSAVMRGEAISFACIEDLPPEAVRERKRRLASGLARTLPFPTKSAAGWAGATRLVAALIRLRVEVGNRK